MHESESDADLEEKSRIERQEIVARYDLGRDEGAKIDDWEDPKLEFYHKQDRWGFIHDERLPEAKTRTEREKKQVQTEVSRAQKWAEMINQDNVKKYFGTKAKYREKMINRVHKGVPDSVRGKFWYILLDLDNIKKQQAGKYQEMRKIARIYSTHIRQIDLDVNRTYREHDMFRERYNSRQQALFHVLATYSVYNSEVGYCQGMSQVAALLLMYLIDEEDAFWALSQLMVDNKYAMHGMFIIGFPKLMRLQAHHDKVLKKFLPRLKKHLDKNGIDTGLYTLKWFFQCFLDRVPFSIAIRVWDLFLLEGERVLTAMAYNILRMHRRYIMRLGMDELIEHLQLNLGKDFGYDDDLVIEKLRDVMHELRSSRLDYAGRPPAEELPQIPFGLVPTTLTSPSKDALGVRMPLSEKEREISTTRIMQIEANVIASGKYSNSHERSGYTSRQISMAEDQSFGDDDSGSNDIVSGVRSTTPPTSTPFGRGNDDVDTSFDVSSDIILPNDSEDILTKGLKGDRTSSGSRGIPSNVSFYPDGTSSPQQKREDAEKMAAQASADKNSHLHNENLKAHSKKSPGATVSEDKNKIVLTVNHKEESQTARRSVMSNYSQSPIKSNKMSGNSSYATQNANSNGSHEKSYLSSPSLVLSRSSDEVNNRMELDPVYNNGAGHQETSTSLNRRRRDPSANNNAADGHHPHYSHHRISSSKTKESSVSSQISNSFPNEPSHYDFSSERNDNRNEPPNRTDKQNASSMQHVIKSTSSSVTSSRVVSDIIKETRHKTVESTHKEDASSLQQSANNSSDIRTLEPSKSASTNKDQNYAQRLRDGIGKNSDDAVKRTRNKLIASQSEKNSKTSTHETYHIEEML